ncbi:MAG: hypothetical protein MK364_14905, partial [Pirellulales bacterium]|nr:hypothetical protein [Pirellulales bacterium]
TRTQEWPDGRRDKPITVNHHTTGDREQHQDQWLRKNGWTAKVLTRTSFHVWVTDVRGKTSST